MKILFSDGYMMTSVWHAPGQIEVTDSNGVKQILSQADWKAKYEAALKNGACRA